MQNREGLSYNGFVDQIQDFLILATLFFSFKFVAYPS
jgi:hypothetical protein